MKIHGKQSNLKNLVKLTNETILKMWKQITKTALDPLHVVRGQTLTDKSFEPNQPIELVKRSFGG